MLFTVPLLPVLRASHMVILINCVNVCMSNSKQSFPQLTSFCFCFDLDIFQFHRINEKTLPQFFCEHFNT